MNIKVGQKVFVTGIYSNSNIYEKEPIVTKIGKKYFQLEGYYNIQFSIETGIDKQSKYSSQYKVYESKEVYEQEKLHIKLSDVIRRSSFYNLKYETLLTIQKLIEDDK
jgi:hypothetical protein